MRWLPMVFLVGCIAPELVPCGELACPLGEKCIDDVVCATQAEISACDGLAEGASCQSEVATGYCSHGACLPNVCGDGALTGNEVCDGGLVPLSCVELGYYSGTPTCTRSCTIDRTGCSGRCGDGMIQSQQGEQCDGGPPATTCADFGADFGTLGCNHFCTPDIIGDCHAYGWQTLLPARTGKVIGAAAVNAHGAIGIDSSDVRILWDGTVTTRGNPGWMYAAADETTMVGASASSIGWFDGATWHELATGIGTASTVALLGGVLYGLDYGCSMVAIDLATGASTALPAPTGAACGWAVTTGGSLYVANDSGVARWDGTSWHYPVVATDVVSVFLGPPGRLLIGRFSTVSALDVTSQLVVPSAAYAINPFVRLAGDLDGNLVTYFNYEGSTSLAMFAGATPMVMPQFPEPQFPTGMGRSVDGDVFAYGAGIYRFGVNSNIITVDTSTLAVSSLQPLADGALGVCGNKIGWLGVVPDFMLATTSWGTGPTAGDTCLRVIGDPRAAHLVEGYDSVYLYAPGSNQYTAELSGYFDGLTGDLSDAWALQIDQVYHRDGTGTWTTLASPVGYSIIAIAGGGGHPLVAIGVAVVGGTSVFQYDGLAWTELAATTEYLNSITTAADGSVFVAGDLTARVEAGQLVEIVNTNLGVTPLAADDVFVRVRADVLEHQAHGVRSTIRVAADALAITPSLLYTWDATQHALRAITRRPLREVGQGL